MALRISVAVVVLVMISGAGALPGSAAGDDAPPERPTIVARAGDCSPLELPACVKEALAANEDLQAERLRMDELEGQMDQALSTGLPTVDLVGDWSRSRDPSFALDSTFGGGGDAFGLPEAAPEWFGEWLGGFGSFIPAPGEIPAQSFLSAKLNLNWTINPLKISGAVGAARLGIRRQELSVLSREHSTAENAIGAFFNIVKAAENVEAVRAQLADQSELLAILRMQYDLDLATRLDTLQAAVTLANLRPQMSIAEAGLRNAGARLNAIMGRVPEAPLTIRTENVVETDPVDEAVALRLARHRPELEAAAVFTDILRRNRRAQKADNRPYLTVFGSYGYVGKTADTLFDDGHDSWRASVAVNVPVFDGLLTRGLVAQTEAQIRRNEVELDSRRRNVEVEVLELLANLTMARQVLDAARLNLERSGEVLDETLLSLQLGKVRYLDVLVAESNRAEALRNVIDARYEVFRLTASLKRSLGWSPLVSLSEIPGLVPEVAR